MNSIKTVLLLGLLSGLLVVGGQMLGGRSGMTMGLILAMGMNFFSYFFSEKIALSMHRAQPVTAQENAEVYLRIHPMVQDLTQRMGLPLPRLWLIPDPSPNAFATGRNPQHSSVAFTAGILGLMNDRELSAVLAHELGHILNRDILISSIAATIGAAITYVAHMAMWFGPSRNDDEEGSPFGGILMIFLAPLAATMIQMAISRTREFGADGAAAKYTGSPDNMIAALRKLERGIERVPMNTPPATAHMFIFPPFLSGGLSKLFSTHPPMEERIAHLESLRGGGALQSLPAR
jgi:heat shock protein HtpX